MSELNLEVEVFFRFSAVKYDQAHRLIILGRNKLIGSPFLPPCRHTGGHGDVKRKERDGVSLAFGIVGLPLGARTTGY